MECKERQELTEAYFDAFRRQQWITQRLVKIREEGDVASIQVAETQERVAIEESYDAWQAMNQHSCSFCK